MRTKYKVKYVGIVAYTVVITFAGLFTVGRTNGRRSVFNRVRLRLSSEGVWSLRTSKKVKEGGANVYGL